MCTVTGSVVQADGSPLVNGVITLNSQKIQVINNVVVNPTVVTTNTDANGNIRAVSLPQGLLVQVTVCPPATGQGQSANCSAPYSAFIPFGLTANFGQLSQGTSLSPPNPPGSPPQLLGWNTSNAVEAETLGGDLTLARTGANAYSATVLKVNGNTPGGTCTSAQVVNAIDTSGRPTCAAPPPGNLGGPYPDTSTWTTTGPQLATNLTMVNTGTLTFPSGSTATSAGFNNVKALGVGASAPTVAGNLALFEDDFNGAANFTVANKIAGANAQSVIYLNNDKSATTGDYAAIGLASSSFTAGGALVPPESYQILASAPGGIEISNATASPINFDLNGLNIARINWIGQVEPDTNNGNGLLDLYSNSANAITSVNLYNNNTSGTNVQALYQVITDNGATVAKFGNTGPAYSGGTNANATYLSSSAPYFNFLTFYSGGIYQFYANGARRFAISPSGSETDGQIYINNSQTTSQGGAWPVMDQGTWTPTHAFNGSTAGISYGVQTGTWVRAGKAVTLEFVTTFTTSGVPAGAAWTLCGLPGQIANQNQGAWVFMNFGGITLPAGDFLGGYYQNGGNQTCILMAAINSNGGAIGGLSSNNVSGGVNVQGSFTYMMPP